MLKIAFEEKITNTIITVKKVFDELNISAYLIGAQARDVWFLPRRSPRITRDIDWVIADSNSDVFNELKTVLIEREGFSKTSNPLKIRSPDGIDVDLIPFNFPDTPHFIGLNEIFERGTEGVIFNDEKTYQVATLPAIVFLKFIAWDNRPEYRGKDIEDIVYILRNFDDFTDNDYMLFGEIEPELIPARAIGRKINYIIGDSLDLQNHFIKILEQLIANPKKNKIAEIMIRGTDENEDFAISLLAEILKGVLEGPLSISADFS
jgi:predicted nucleotidyltransferase